MSISADMAVVRKKLRRMFPEWNDWDLVAEVNDMLTPEQEERVDIESDIICPLVMQGVPFDEIYAIVDKEIEAMGLEPMRFNPELSREDFI